MQPHEVFQHMFEQLFPVLYPKDKEVLDDFCGICDVAGKCTCANIDADDSKEQFYADRATWLSEREMS